MGKNVPAPTVFDGHPQVPFPTYAIFETVKKDHVMTPGQFCSKLQKSADRATPAKERM
jgi:hypothetical protein